MHLLARVLLHAVSTLGRGSWGGCIALLLTMSAVCTLLRASYLSLSDAIGALVVLSFLVVILRLITGFGHR